MGVKMDSIYWHERWKNKKTGFHRDKANPLLKKYIKTMNLKSGSRIFLPLCGKTKDINWLLEQGFQIRGIELVQKVVEELFLELKLVPKVEKKGNLVKFSAQNIEVYSGDFFSLKNEDLGEVEMVYDRASLVALPKEKRLNYTKHLSEITNFSSQLLISYLYDQEQMDGPPFSITEEEILMHYADQYKITCVHSEFIQEEIRGNKEIKEEVRSLLRG